jgi:hypothetical protein
LFTAPQEPTVDWRAIVMLGVQAGIAYTALFVLAAAVGLPLLGGWVPSSVENAGNIVVPLGAVGWGLARECRGWPLVVVAGVALATWWIGWVVSSLVLLTLTQLIAGFLP